MRPSVESVQIPVRGRGAEPDGDSAEDRAANGRAEEGDVHDGHCEEDAGEDLLEAGWKATIKAFEQNLTAVREGLDELDGEAIMHDEDLVRHACHNLGAYRGPSVVLYDEHGQGIRDRDRLNRILDGVESCWIVPADVHY